MHWFLFFFFSNLFLKITYELYQLKFWHLVWKCFFARSPTKSHPFVYFHDRNYFLEHKINDRKRAQQSKHIVLGKGPSIHQKLEALAGKSTNAPGRTYLLDTGSVCTPWKRHNSHGLQINILPWWKKQIMPPWIVTYCCSLDLKCPPKSPCCWRLSPQPTALLAGGRTFRR